jgi:hypothetical protein
VQDERRGPDGTDAVHPDLELLLNRAGGLLDAETAARVDVHLENCAACRLEVKRLARFEALDTDDETAAAAGWGAAAERLDAAWQRTVRPAVHAAPARRGLPRWLAPVAAAAAVACVAFLVGLPDLPDQRPGSPDTMRGGSAVPAITGSAPVGEIAAAPAGFAWETERDFDSFVLEVFTEDLATVLRLEDLETSRVDLPDSVRGIFAAGTTYFWHVEGREGLSATAASASVWFRVVAAED